MLTTAQERDLRLSLGAGAVGGGVQGERRLYRAEDERRRKAGGGAYVECPRCREMHGWVEGYRGVCRVCRLTLLDEWPHHPFTLAMEAAEGWVRKGGVR